MSDPLIRTRTPAEILAHVAAELREQPDATALLAHSMTLDMLAEELTAESEPPRTEWANRLELPDGHSELHEAGPVREGGGERMARHRMQYAWYTALLKRTVTYGPWVEVPVEKEEA